MIFKNHWLSKQLSPFFNKSKPILYQHILYFIEISFYSKIFQKNCDFFQQKEVFITLNKIYGALSLFSYHIKLFLRGITEES